jgi:hypothetical protein
LKKKKFPGRKLETYGSLVMAMDRAMARDGIDILDLASLQRLSYQRYDPFTAWLFLLLFFPNPEMEPSVLNIIFSNHDSSLNSCCRFIIIHYQYLSFPR